VGVYQADRRNRFGNLLGGGAEKTLTKNQAVPLNGKQRRTGNGYDL
jgi:hypothetical protein